MAKFSGTKCTVATASVSGNWGSGIVVNNVKSWSGELAFDPKDTTSQGDGVWRSQVYGHKQMTGQIVMFGDSATAISDVTTTEPTVTLNLYDDSADKSFAFTATLERVSISTNFNDGSAPEVTFAFKSNGAVTIT